MRKIYVIGPINSEAYESFSRSLDKLNAQSDKSIEVEVHSEGGSGYDGLAFYGKMLASRSPILVTAHGMVHSAAIAILLGGSWRRCTPEVSFMVHESSERIKGFSSNLQKHAERAMDEERAWDRLMELETGTPAFFWRDLHKNESYLTASQALQYGLVHKIMKGPDRA